MAEIHAPEPGGPLTEDTTIDPDPHGLGAPAPSPQSVQATWPRGVIIVCGERSYRWREAPPTFSTAHPKGQLIWQRSRCIGEDENYVPIWLYHLSVFA